MNKLIMLLAVTLLAGCGGSSNKSSVLTDKATVTPKEVHNIQPKDIPQYIEKFKQDHARLEFLLDGISYDLSFVDNEGNQIFAQYEKGLIIIGFDLDTGKPIKELTVLEGDISNLQKLINAPTRRLTAHNIEVSEKNGDAIYIGQLMDPTTTGLYPVSLTINEALLSGGSSKIKVVDDQAYITGALGTEFYIQMQDLIANSPQVKTLVLQNIEGSINDDINLHSGRLARLEPEQTASAYTNFDLVLAVHQALRNNAHWAEQSQLDINFTCPEELTIRAIDESLGVMLDNLFANAFKYALPSSSVKLTIEPLDKALIISTENDCKQLPAYLLEHMFDRFIRGVDETTQGSGLGMSIIQRSAQLHQGNVTIEPLNSGNRLKVTISLPVLV